MKVGSTKGRKPGVFKNGFEQSSFVPDSGSKKIKPSNPRDAFSGDEDFKDTSLLNKKGFTKKLAK